MTRPTTPTTPKGEEQIRANYIDKICPMDGEELIHAETSDGRDRILCEKHDSIPAPQHTSPEKEHGRLCSGTHASEECPSLP